MNNIKLTSTERHTLSNIIAVFQANPFSAKRIEADRKIADFPPDSTYTERYEKLTEGVARAVNQLLSEGKDDIRKFEGEDRKIIEAVFIYHVYNQFFQRFDPLIEKQLTEGGTECKIPFASDVLSAIERFGFSPEEALHFLAVYFQLRRAYYFIRRGIIGNSPCMGRLRESLWNNVFTEDLLLYAKKLWDRLEDFSTLLLGETGTGKGISARAIGQSGYIPFDKKSGCFVESFPQSFTSVNLSQFPEQLIESELFGHTKGAFTGAISNHEGALSWCSRYGAIFLDEIGEVSVPVQIKLLQVLENRHYSPVGSHEIKRFPGRIIAATNQSLDDLRRKKKFRDDFYYRLCSDVIFVPPLRQRIDESPVELDDLVKHTIKRIVGEGADELASHLTHEIHKNVPNDYSWPGNVRELEQCIRRILLKQNYEIEHSTPESTNLEDDLINGVRSGSIDAQNLLSHYCRLLYNKYGSYEDVARRTQLDRRTVKKYIGQQKSQE
jgi:DNA-binding NtrC family response regulator